MHPRTAQQVQVRAGQSDVCQSANVETQDGGQRLPLIITGAGNAELTINAGATPPGGIEHGIIYIDATAAS